MGHGPGPAQVCRVASSRRRRGEFTQKYKNKILDETYLEQRWGAVKHVILKRISARFFFEKSVLKKKLVFSKKVCRYGPFTRFVNKKSDFPKKNPKYVYLFYLYVLFFIYYLFIVHPDLFFIYFYRF